MFKKFNNLYEYIYSGKNKNNICKIINPISRSYFKLHEICIDNNINLTGNILCLAEAPGGFIKNIIDHLDIRVTLAASNFAVSQFNNSVLHIQEILDGLHMWVIAF